MEVLFAILGVVVGALVGLVICSLLLMLVLPLYGSVGLFVNGPDGLERSGFHIFTKLGPGQVKIIERGDKLVRMISDTANKRFARNGAINSLEHWELIDSREPDDPVADVWLPIRWWARKVYEKTGLVFTGIYPFQKVREYRLQRTAIERRELKERQHETNVSNLLLTVSEDLSDHFRTRQFLWPIYITAAETSDKIPLDIIGVAEMEVTNPYQTAYGTDRWDFAVINLVTDKINEKTRTLKLDATLTAGSSTEARVIAKSVESITDDELHCGIKINNFRILEINPVVDAEGRKDLQAEALSTQRAKAIRIDGQARADALRAINEANEAGGDSAKATMEAEALVRAAEAASKAGGTVILMPGSRHGDVDPTQSAILAELKKLNRRE